jgi:hypothetical protein
MALICQTPIEWLVRADPLNTICPDDVFDEDSQVESNVFATKCTYSLEHQRADHARESAKSADYGFRMEFVTSCKLNAKK